MSQHEDEQSQSGEEQQEPSRKQIRRAENLVLVLLALAIAAVAGLAFIYDYFDNVLKTFPDELMGLCMGLALAFVAAALAVVGKRLVVTEELEDEYPSEHPEAQEEVADLVHKGGARFTRKKLLLGAAGATVTALAASAVASLASLGSYWSTGRLDSTPWRRGRRLVDEDGVPIRAADIEPKTFYSAFAEHADPEDISTELVVVRIDPAQLQLPRGRKNWAPYGIMAYSKICTHAGCAVALYRKPTFRTLEPYEALVCPCHYSTFDVATGGTVVYGPAGRPLPQLPLMIDADGYLAAAGNFSDRVGPGWFNVLKRPTNA